MITRSLIAFIACITCYMTAVMMTVYDGVLSLMFQPIVGTIISVVSIGFIAVIGSPILNPKIWSIWKRFWIVPFLMLFASLILMYVSWLPQYREMVSDPDTGNQVPTFNMALAFTGWFIMIFAILWNPKLGFVKDKKWI